VIVLAVPDRNGRAHGVSKNLRRASDAVELCDAEALDSTVAVAAPKPRKPGPHVVAAATPRTIPLPKTSSLFPGASDAKLAYASGIGGGPPTIAAEYRYTEGELKARIGDVVKGVIDSFLASDAGERRSALEKGRPYILGDLDKALLMDLSHSLGDYVLSDDMRRRVRDEFWEAWDRTI
jgi:hypothetical protein